MSDLLFVAFILGAGTHASVVDEGRRPVCVSNCVGIADGDYQSCTSCNKYVTCSNGIMFPDRPCAADSLVWDDNEKRCLFSSLTCPCNITKLHGQDIYCAKEDMIYKHNMNSEECIMACAGDKRCHSVCFHTDQQTCHLNYCQQSYRRRLGNVISWIKGNCQEYW